MPTISTGEYELRKELLFIHSTRSRSSRPSPAVCSGSEEGKEKSHTERHDTTLSMYVSQRVRYDVFDQFDRYFSGCEPFFLGHESSNEKR
jgi:hypothetical protein